MVVIGGGASGTLVAVHLLRRHTGDLRVCLVDRRRELGQGTAYSTRSVRHLLNVPASKMSALADNPDHFLRWRTWPKSCSGAGRTTRRRDPRWGQRDAKAKTSQEPYDPRR